MLETLLGGFLGGLLRLAPELLKFFDRKGEREHELKMVTAEMDFAKIKAEVQMRQSDNQVTVKEFEAISTAFKDQSETAKAAGKIVAGISALVRPLVTYIFVLLFAAVKIAAFFLALSQGGDWKMVLVTMWGTDDLTVLNMILSFWFVGRVYERNQSK